MYFEVCKRFEKYPNPNPNPNTQQIENPNPDLNLWVLLGAYVWLREEMEGGRGLVKPKRFFRLSGRFMAAPTQEPRKKIKNLKKRKFSIILILNII